MNTFMNAVRLALVTLLFVSLNIIGNCCPTKGCAPKACTTKGCRLPIQPVTIRKTCDHPGFVKQVCHLEYEPCEGKVEEVTATPVYVGCYDEQGNEISSGASYNNGSSRKVMRNGNRRVVTPTIEVIR